MDANQWINKLSKETSVLLQALEGVKTKNIELVRGPVFVWSEDLTIIKCNAIGALLIHFNLAQLGFPDGWLENLCKEANISRAWLWRLSHGWDYGNQLSFTYTEKNSDKEKTVADATSKEANKLAQQIVKNKS